MFGAGVRTRGHAHNFVLADAKCRAFHLDLSIRQCEREACKIKSCFGDVDTSRLIIEYLSLQALVHMSERSR